MGKRITRNKAKERRTPTRKEPKFGFYARELNRKTKAYQRRHKSVNYVSALNAVAVRYPELYDRYRREAPSWRDEVLNDLAELAEFLNKGGGPADKMLRLIKPVLNWKTAPQEVVKNAAMGIAAKLNAIQTYYVPIFAGKRPVFTRTSGGKGYWVIVSAAFATGQFSLLRSCHYCGSFFVTKNKNIYLCPEKECGKNQRRKQAGDGMAKHRAWLREETTKNALSTLSKMIESWRISGTPLLFLQDDLENKRISGKGMKTILDGVGKKKNPLEILNEISAHGRNRLAEIPGGEARYG